MDIILFGVQGSGKGTQGQLIAKRYKLSVFDTGNELRQLILEESTLAKKVRDIMETGNLVPTEIVMEIIENFINKTQGAIIFDGIPRSKEQAECFNKLMKKNNRNLKGIFIDMNKEEAIQRLLKRARSDDNEKSIRVRLDTYQNETLPVIEEYENDHLVKRVNGEQSIENVSKDIFAILDSVFLK